MFPRAEANPILIEPYLQMMSQQAVIAGAAANQENNGQETASKTVLSKNERQTLEGIQSSLTRDYQLASASAMALGMMLRNWVNGDDDLYSHEHLKKIADNKGTAETRVRYRFAENAETGQLTAVGYHTSKENMLEPVKVRHVQYNKSLNRYEFWEDGASSPTLVWYQNAASGGLSQQDIDKSVSQDATVNVKVAVLDPQATGQTPGLPIPEEKNWRDGAYINPQQDPSEIGGNSTSTPIPDGRDSGPSKLTTPAPKEKDFRDYILIFPVAGIPPIYVYMNCPYGGTEKGKYSGRSYDPTKAGGSVQDLDWRNIEITQEGIDKVKLHTSRFDESVENQIMIERLEKILSGEIPITDYDRRFYTHETRELERYRALGVPDGANDLITWNNAHTATLEDYKINEKVEPLYTPEAIAIAIERES
ncbi:Hcp family T6SS protein CtsH2 [Xenorhabdus mauleonii]|uniref:Hcp family T6SS protein CtsH2 n=1 Tax=Xenorhabdus mauleonii TaxID=351675 RepID=A0A2G0NLN9_9GAMM|nr:Hcp family T6SS protein CtsH2 [Xenorhabdus mauleonii]